MGQEQSALDEPSTLGGRSIEGVAEYIKSGSCKRIVVMSGAGISTAAGIPDFRSPQGLYANLDRLNLPSPQAVFDIEYFSHTPGPFYELARELYPGRFSPTVSHMFIAMLARKGMLTQLFTQNIDCLERQAGVPENLIVEAHGSFATSSCMRCKTPFPDTEMRGHVFRGSVPHCPLCSGLVKPDIVFFGEALPTLFQTRAHHARAADLVFIMGTSLTVYPFAGLPEEVPEKTPRVLFNMQRVGRLGSRPDDVLVLEECDAGVRKLCDALGWREELEAEWRRLVGAEEAERQVRSASTRGKSGTQHATSEAERPERTLAEGVDALDPTGVREEKGKDLGDQEVQRLAIEMAGTLQIRDRDFDDPAKPEHDATEARKAPSARPRTKSPTLQDRQTDREEPRTSAAVDYDAAVAHVGGDAERPVRHLSAAKRGPKSRLTPHAKEIETQLSGLDEPPNHESPDGDTVGKSETASRPCSQP